MTTTTPLTLSELADIGSKAACVQLGLEQDDSQTLIVHPCPGYERDAPAREAFTKAILDAIGYKLLVDFEREAYDKWASQEGPIAGLFEAFKAGRAMLRESMEKQCHSALDEIIPQTAKQPETTWTRHIPGDPRPCDASTFIDALIKSDEDDGYIECLGRYIKHDSTWGEIIGWRYASKQPKNDGWISWSGGDRPVDGEVQVHYRNGSRCAGLARSFDWKYRANESGDIIFYKLIPTTTK